VERGNERKNHIKRNKSDKKPVEVSFLSWSQKPRLSNETNQPRVRQQSQNPNEGVESLTETTKGGGVKLNAPVVGKNKKGNKHYQQRGKEPY